MSDDPRERYTCEDDLCTCPSCVQGRIDHRAITRELAAAARPPAAPSTQAPALDHDRLHALALLHAVADRLEAWALREAHNAREDYARSRSERGAEAVGWHSRAGAHEATARHASQAAQDVRAALGFLQAAQAPTRLGAPSPEALERVLAAMAALRDELADAFGRSRLPAGPADPG